MIIHLSVILIVIILCHFLGKKIIKNSRQKICNEQCPNIDKTKIELEIIFLKYYSNDSFSICNFQATKGIVYFCAVGILYGSRLVFEKFGIFDPLLLRSDICLQDSWAFALPLMVAISGAYLLALYETNYYRKIVIKAANSSFFNP